MRGMVARYLRKKALIEENTSMYHKVSGTVFYTGFRHIYKSLKKKYCQDK